MKQTEDFTEKNIRALCERQQEKLRNKSRTHRVASWIANFSGTVAFAVIHVIFFSAWIAFNSTKGAFDEFPFILLTLIVSLESIFLSTFVLLTQNELAKETDERHNLDLQINLLAEKQSTALIKVVIELARKAGIPEEDLKELQEMANDTSPEDILQKISDIEQENNETS